MDTVDNALKTHPIARSAAKDVKVVIWDLDNTLWSGILSEGDALQLNAAVPEILKQLDARGILSCIVSKNDHDPAMEQVKRFGVADWFVLPMIGWGDKSTSIRRIAERLNLGLDTFLFIDDQAFEREAVQHSLPEVRTLDVADLGGLLERPDVNPEQRTTEALQRRRMYQDEMQRQDHEAIFEGTPEDFLATLNLEFTVRKAEPGDLDRAVELTQRTNQLNSTGYTYSYDELLEMISDPDHQLLVAEMTDRYGSYGVIGLSLMRLFPGERRLLLLLMSCRVLSRGAGSLLLRELVAAAHHAGDKLYAEIVRTGRNRQMQMTYQMAGFSIAEVEGNRVLLHWSDTAPAPRPDYFKVSVRDV